MKKFAIDSITTLVFLHKNQILLNPIYSIVSTNHRYFTASRLYPETAISPKNTLNRDLYTVSYLINQCGLSPETAISVSEKVHFKTPEKPDSVLNFLRNHGFNKTHIAILVRKRPLLLLADPQKTLLPKLEFLQSIGVTSTDIARTLSSSPDMLTRSVDNQIKPSYNFLNSVLRSNEKIIAILKRAAWVFLEDHTKNLAPNIAVLREVGVPESCIILLLSNYTHAAMAKQDQFRKIVNKVLEMGFNPLQSMFVLAVHVCIGKSNKLIWDRCLKVYKKWGWSDDEIQLAFRKHPHCMILSEKKISCTMDFLVNKMGWQSTVIARCPSVLFFSLEKRIIPRCSVFHVLSLKGLIKKLSLSTVLLPAEKYFLEKFVTKYEDEVPQLLSVYQGKLYHSMEAGLILITGVILVLQDDVRLRDVSCSNVCVPV